MGPSGHATLLKRPLDRRRGDCSVLVDAQQILPEQEDSITDSRRSPEDVLFFFSDRTDG